MGEYADAQVERMIDRSLRVAGPDPIRQLVDSRRDPSILRGKAPAHPSNVEEIIAQYLIHLNGEDETWTTREGLVIRISEMTLSHVINAYEMVVRNTTKRLRLAGYANLDGERIFQHTRIGARFRDRILAERPDYFPTEKRES